VASWRDRQAEVGRSVDRDVPPDAAERLAVNYLRHELTAYDDHLAALYRRVGKDAACDAINEKVYEAISRAYPELANLRSATVKWRASSWRHRPVIPLRATRLVSNLDGDHLVLEVRRRVRGGRTGLASALLVRPAAVMVINGPGPAWSQPGEGA
jgi:hypothetical protein